MLKMALTLLLLTLPLFSVIASPPMGGYDQIESFAEDPEVSSHHYDYDCYDLSQESLKKTVEDHSYEHPVKPETEQVYDHPVKEKEQVYDHPFKPAREHVYDHPVKPAREHTYDHLKKPVEEQYGHPIKSVEKDESAYDHPFKPIEEHVYDHPVETAGEHEYDHPIKPEEEHVYDHPVKPEEEHAYDPPFKPVEEHVYDHPFKPVEEHVYDHPFKPVEEHVYDHPVKPEPPYDRPIKFEEESTHGTSIKPIEEHIYDIPHHPQPGNQGGSHWQPVRKCSHGRPCKVDIPKMSDRVWDRFKCYCFLRVGEKVVFRRKDRDGLYSCTSNGLRKCSRYCDYLFEDEELRLISRQNACDVLNEEVYTPWYRRNQICGPNGSYEDIPLEVNLCCRRGRPCHR